MTKVTMTRKEARELAEAARTMTRKYLSEHEMQVNKSFDRNPERQNDPRRTMANNLTAMQVKLTRIASLLEMVDVIEVTP